MLATHVCLASLLIAAPRQSDDGRILEAEAFDACDATRTPRKHDQPFASARTVLIHFPGVQRISWTLAAPVDGPLDVWLRYSSRRTANIDWWVGDRGAERTALPASGGFEGRGVWRWPSD